MMDFFKALVKQPYWIIALILGVALVSLPCVTIDKDYHFTSHSPNTLFPVVIGIALLLLSSLAFWFTLFPRRSTNISDLGAGLDLTRVKESDGVLSTMVGGCEIRIVNGRIENQPREGTVTIALPCNEYF